MTCRAGLRGLLRGVTHLLRQVTSSGPQRLKALRWWFIITTRKARFSACQSLYCPTADKRHDLLESLMLLRRGGTPRPFACWS